MATFYIPSGSYWSSGSYRMRLKVDQSYNSSTNKSVLTVTPQFYGSAGATQTLVSGLVRYSTDGGSTKTNLWDFSKKTSGGSYPYAAPFDASWGNLTRQVSDTSWETSKPFTVTHGADGNATVYFYAESVQSTGSNGISGSSNYTFPGTAQTYKLTISQGTGTTVTVTRNGTALANNATITYGDTLVISFSTGAGYNLATHTVNGVTFTSGNSKTVTGAVSVVTTATVKSFTLTTSAATGTTISVNRTASPLKGAATGTLTSGATIYYGDTLVITASASGGYQIQSFTVNGTAKTSPASVTVSSNVTVATTAALVGSAQIGTDFSNYSPYIRGASSFEQYRPYIWENGAWTEY